MCCDICPFYDECDELDETVDECCRECPDYEDCRSAEEAPAGESEERDSTESPA